MNVHLFSGNWVLFNTIIDYLNIETKKTTLTNCNIYLPTTQSQRKKDQFSYNCNK